MLGSRSGSLSTGVATINDDEHADQRDGDGQEGPPFVTTPTGGTPGGPDVTNEGTAGARRVRSCYVYYARHNAWMPVIQARVSNEVLEDLDRRAKLAGMGRSQLVRELLAGPAPVGGAASLGETLELLSARARAGVVSAQIALLRHLAVREHESEPARVDDPLAEVDELARRE
jgi:hypothetical protein